MNRPYKTTGCFRFFLFIIILAPLAYLGASYYHGQDGIQNIKNLFSKGIAVFNGSSISDTKKETKQEPAATSDVANTDIINDYKATIQLKEKQLDALIKENLELKQKLQELQNKELKKPVQ